MRHFLRFLPSLIAFAMPLFVRAGNLPPEYLVFEVPQIPVYGPFLHSWYVLRGPLLWVPNGSFDLSKTAWPTWDTKQVPSALTYTGTDQASVIIYDAENSEIERVALTKSFIPLLYKGPEEKVPHHFRIVMVPPSGRVSLSTKEYPWPKTKELFRCDIKVIERDLSTATVESKSDSLLGAEVERGKSEQPLENHDQVKACMDSLQGVAKTAGPEKQWYVNITWPKILSRRAAQYVSDVERLLRTGLGKNKHVLITKKGDGKRFSASAGHTQIELLEKPSLQVESLPNRQWHGPAPSREKGTENMAQFTTADGGLVKIFSFANDTVGRRSLDAPSEFDPPINIQFVKKPEEESTGVRQTDFREERTGIFGFLRPWYVAGSMNYHNLKSGRGEELSSLNISSLEVAWKSPYYNLEPYFTLEPGLYSEGSPLILQEGHVGSRWRWREHLAPYLGYFVFSLRGTNPGASRLGSIDGISAGLSGEFRFEDYIVRGWLGAVATTPLSFDTYLQLSKVVDRTMTDRGLFVGFFIGSTLYRQEVVNLTRQLEVFSETRFKLGIVIGLAGAEFLKR